jgi:hypothetical protein
MFYDYLVFILCFAFFSFLFLKMSFVKKSALTPFLLVTLYTIKIFAGIMIGWIYKEYYPFNDYWGLHEDGLIEFQLLKNSPIRFFLNIVQPHQINGYGQFFYTSGSFWNNLGNTLVAKCLGITNFIAQGNYYINSLILNSFGFLGHIALYRVFKLAFPSTRLFIIIGCFLLPSTLFFSSGIHKDLFIFTFFAELFKFLLCFS